MSTWWLVCYMILSIATIAFGPFEQQISPNYAISNWFGSKVDICGNYSIMSSYGDNSRTGAAYIYQLNASTLMWTQHTKLVPSDAVAGDEWGYSVAIDGNYAVLGSYRYNNEAGAVYVFERNVISDTWIQKTKLLPSDSSSYTHFGFSVDISNTYIIIGRNNDDPYNAGSAYIFERNMTNDIWIQLVKLTAVEAIHINDYFGTSVAINIGSNYGYSIIGASWDDAGYTQSGAAYIFELNMTNNIWSETSRLIASDRYSYDYFGIDVDIYKDYAIVGAWQHDGVNSNEGRAYIFKRDINGNWAEIQELVPSHIDNDNEWFGVAVAMSLNYIIVGASKDGSIYLYEKISNISWNEIGYIEIEGGSFGTSIGIDEKNGYAIIGDHGYGNTYILTNFSVNFVYTTTAQPTTMEPTTAQPTIPPTTAQPSGSPITSKPTTFQPSNVPTTSTPSVSPITLNPTVSPTDNPITLTPTTFNPTTSTPTTSMPTTLDPTTATPTTATPTTATPTTSIPTTSTPTTSNPTTSNPTTSNPTTSKPTTSNPSTATPTTSDPSTEQPSTSKPTTSNPTISEQPTIANRTAMSYSSTDNVLVTGNVSSTAQATPDIVDGVSMMDHYVSVMWILLILFLINI